MCVSVYQGGIFVSGLKCKHVIIFVHGLIFVVLFRSAHHCSSLLLKGNVQNENNKKCSTI